MARHSFQNFANQLPELAASFTCNRLLAYLNFKRRGRRSINDDVRTPKPDNKISENLLGLYVRFRGSMKFQSCEVHAKL